MGLSPEKGVTLDADGCRRSGNGPQDSKLDPKGALTADWIHCGAHIMIMKGKIELSLFKDPDPLWLQLSREFKADPRTKTKFGEDLWIVSLFFCFYNREFSKSFVICTKHSDEWDKDGIDVAVKEKTGALREIQAKYFPTSSVIENRKRYRGPATIHINTERAEEYLRRNTEEIEKMAVSYLKRKLRNDYDFVVIYLDTPFEQFTWLESVVAETGLERTQIRAKEVWAFKNEKIAVPRQDIDKVADLHRYRFFRLFPKFENYGYESLPIDCDVAGKEKDEAK